MRFQPIRPATAWAVLCMEAALAAVPLTLVGAPLLLVLLPLGYVLPSLVADRVPLLGRVALVPGGAAPPWTPRQGALGDGVPKETTPPPRLRGGGWGVGLALSVALWTFTHPPTGILWLFSALVPSLMGLVAWWRGGLLARSEVGARDVRAEFVLLGGLALTVMVVMRGLATAPGGLLDSAGLVFVASGLLALVLARQDAAEAYRTGGARTLAVLTALAPVVLGLGLVGLLTPALVSTGWTLFGDVLRVLFAPLVALLQWLASLLPAFGGPVSLPPGTGRPPLPDLSQLEGQGSGPPAWVGWLVLGVLVLLGIGMVVIVVKLLLEWTAARRQPTTRQQADAPDEQVGSASKDARAALGWLMAWLRRWLGGQAGTRPADQARGGRTPDGDARAAYRALLAWARAEGVPRGQAETTQHLKGRLVQHAPDAAATFELVTDVYESDRYGETPPSRERLAAIKRQLEHLPARSEP